MNNTIKYLSAICNQNARIEVLMSTQEIPADTMAGVNFALSLTAHLLDELEQKDYSPAYMEMQVDRLIKRVDNIIASMPTIIHYRGIVAKISLGSKGYECKVTDRLGNDLRWLLNTNYLPIAIDRAESHFDGAIACLRGFSTTGEFFGRMYGYGI